MSPKGPRLHVGTYWVNKFPSPIQSLKYSDNMAQGFGQKMSRQGHTWTDVREEIASVDQWLYPYSRQHPGADTMDFAYLCTHSRLWATGNDWGLRIEFGAESKATGRTVFFTFSTYTTRGPYKGLCKTILGKKLKWLVVDTCDSLALETKFEKRTMEPPEIWEPVFAGLHMVFGHGQLSTSGWYVRKRGKEFASRITGGSKLSEAWLDTVSSWWRCDDVPVVLAIGKSEDEAKKVLYEEDLINQYCTVKHRAVDGGVCWHWRWRE